MWTDITDITDIIIVAGSLLNALLLQVIAFVLLHEKQGKAAIKAMALIPLSLIPLFLSLSETAAGRYLNFVLLFITAAVLIYLFIPSLFFPKTSETKPSGRIDERNTMFSRNELKSGSKRFEEYYTEFPHHKPKDDVFRSNPGLLNKKSAFYNPLAFAMADAGFETVAAFHPLVNGKVKDDVADLPVEKIDNFIRKWLKERGVVSAGVTVMKDYHWYSMGGRGDRYGKKYKPREEYGIAFTVEMDEKMVACTPKAPIVMESAQQYLNAGTIAIQLAVFLRNLGFEARAHIDGNYEVVCPLVARDAGLGEIGRMGLLMTPRLGPRVRSRSYHQCPVESR